MKNIIIPSVIAKSQAELDERTGKVKKYSSLIQLDIMDGEFVPNRSFDFDFKLPKVPKRCILEAHLMINNPEQWIERHWKKVDTIIVHAESRKDLSEIIKFVKRKRRKVGIALNPWTPVEAILRYLDRIDQVLFMTVSPGFYGGKFLPETLSKVKILRQLKPKMDIEVDGGISPDTIKMAADAGANKFVVGSYLMESKDVKKAVNILKGPSALILYLARSFPSFFMLSRTS